MVAKEDFNVWWENEGSAITPIDGHDMEEHVKRVSLIAWLNGADKALEFAKELYTRP